jgi:hypothetical protein
MIVINNTTEFDFIVVGGKILPQPQMQQS